ncbi:MAG: aspartate kinase, partial [Desulfobacteraceae bacterium]|nr:aspartate kinase [Desulfobacteraceae bacterium]
MALRVQKYGGTSVADIERISNVADRVQKAYDKGDQVVVVLSAMAGVTDTLISLAKQASENPDKRELDVLLATGEQTTAALLAMILKSRGYQAKSFLGFQAGIHTDKASGKARIMDIDCKKVQKALDNGNIAVMAGFQGTDRDGNITTLG